MTQLYLFSDTAPPDSAVVNSYDDLLDALAHAGCNTTLRIYENKDHVVRFKQTYTLHIRNVLVEFCGSLALLLAPNWECPTATRHYLETQAKVAKHRVNADQARGELFCAIDAYLRRDPAAEAAHLKKLLAANVALAAIDAADLEPQVVAVKANDCVRMALYHVRANAPNQHQRFRRTLENQLRKLVSDICGCEYNPRSLTV